MLLHRVLHAVQNQKSAHGIAVELQSAVGADMGNGNPTCLECRGHQQTAVALQRLSLCAHECNAARSRTLRHAVETLLERDRRAQALVVDSAVLVARGIVR